MGDLVFQGVYAFATLIPTGWKKATVSSPFVSGVDIIDLLVQNAKTPAFCVSPPTDDDKFIYDPSFGNVSINRWFIARLQYIQCVSNGDTAVLH